VKHIQFQNVELSEQSVKNRSTLDTSNQAFIHNLEVDSKGLFLIVQSTRKNEVVRCVSIKTKQAFHTQYQDEVVLN
jgi:hypothetical protein